MLVKIFRYVLLGAALLVVSTAALFVLMMWSETVESSYPDRHAADAAGATAEGKWLSRWLPASARDIRETHNIDTNAIWLTFRFDRADLAALSAHCADIVESPALPRKQPVRWWPRALTSGSAESAIPAAFTYRRCRDGQHLAIDDRTNIAYSWRYRWP